MATTFPNQIQTFPTMQDIAASDASLVAQYQAAMQAGNFTQAQQILVQISNAQSKIINADLLNTMADTIEAMETYFSMLSGQKIVVSQNEPAVQAAGNFWWQETN